MRIEGLPCGLELIIRPIGLLHSLLAHCVDLLEL